MPDLLDVAGDRKATYLGGAVKALGHGRIGGYLVKFGEVDAQGDEFLPPPACDYGLEERTRARLVWNHGLGALGPKRIGTVELAVKGSTGIWAEGTLDTGASPAVAALGDRLLRGELFFSSGSVDRLVRREARGDHQAIKSWPIIEASLTDRPVSRSTPARAISIKSWPGAAAAEAEGDFLMVPETAIKSFNLLGLDGAAAFLHLVRTGQGLGSYNSACKSLGLAEATDSDGGILVPPGWSDGIWRAALEREFSPLALATRRFTESNVYTLRTTADSNRAEGYRSGGLAVSRIGEGGQLTSVAPRLRAVESRLLKKAIYTEVSEELVDDAPGLLEDLTGLVAAELEFHIVDEMFHGTGAGTLQGILNSPAKITVAAEGSQTAGTLNASNVVKMFARMYGPARYSCVWHCNVDVDVNLLFLTMPADTTSAALVNFQQPGTVAGSPYAHVCGRPVIPLEQCPTLGTEGDLILCHWPDYLVCGKGSGIRRTGSAHVKFDQDLQAFKWTWRVDGRPIWEAPRTPARSSTQQSPFVTLATRA